MSIGPVPSLDTQQNNIGKRNHDFEAGIPFENIWSEDIYIHRYYEYQYRWHDYQMPPNALARGPSVQWWQQSICLRHFKGL